MIELICNYKTMNEDIWNLIKSDFLGLGKHPKQYFTSWCPTSPGAQAIRNSEEFALYQADNRKQCKQQETEGLPQTTPTWAHWRKDNLTRWPGRANRPYAYDIIQTVRHKFELTSAQRLGRVHIWMLYSDLQGLSGPWLQERAQWKIQVDGKIWDRNFSQPWIEVLKGLMLPLDQDNCGPNFDMIGRANNRPRVRDQSDPWEE